MLNISMQQLLTVWIELEDAYNNCNSYAGDTAEIYACRVMPYSPAYVATKNDNSSMFTDDNTKLELQAAKSLYEILLLFKEKRECKVFIDGEELGEWFLAELFHHRCHVKIERVD